MKKYDILRHNKTSSFIFEILIHVLVISACFLFPGLYFIKYGMVALAIMPIALVPITLIMSCIQFWGSKFYYDEKNEKIILKIFRTKERTFQLSSIEVIYPKRNADSYMGAVNRSGAWQYTVFAVQSKDEYILFYFVKDKPILDFFREHGIKVKLSSD